MNTLNGHFEARAHTNTHLLPLSRSALDHGACVCVSGCSETIQHSRGNRKEWMKQLGEQRKSRGTLLTYKEFERM